MRYAFTFDASACTGCKACQVACKDKHALPPGLLWRRVYEVAGGGWERRGAAWTNTVFAYHVSVACNHCAQPACVDACPTGACAAREDGIVWIDAARCAGCEYCAWACPYSAPQYSRELGRVTKCDFCRDLLDEGLAPACVAACPMRALDVTRGAELPAAAHPYPLPAPLKSRPQLAIKPHAAMLTPLPKHVANREEVRPAGRHAPATVRGLPLDDLPLVLFTLLGQAAAGLAAVAWLAPGHSLPVLVTIAVLAAAAAVVSLLHLGAVTRAWRAPANARTSPLSREIVALGLFAAAWTSAWYGVPGGGALLAAAGLALVLAMAAVYDIDGVAAWGRARARLAFASSALVFGLVGLLALSPAAPAWLVAIVAAAVVVDQVARRWRFYGERRALAM